MRLSWSGGEVVLDDRPEIVALAERYDAFVMLDEAHATGVLGPGGAGTLEQFGLAGRVPVLMGTLGNSAYFAAKFGVRGFTEAVRSELRRTEVRVTAVYPGVVKTNLAPLSSSR